MTKTNFKQHEAISYAGWGHQGFCGPCSFYDPTIQKEVDSRIPTWSPEKLNDWLETRELPTFNRQTWYKHRRHVMHPKDRVVTAVVKRELLHGTNPQTVSEDAFLDALVAIGNRKATENPDEVTIDHALRAVQIKQAAKSAGTGGMSILIAVLTDRTSAPQMSVIEGEVREVREINPSV